MVSHLTNNETYFYPREAPAPGLRRPRAARAQGRARPRTASARLRAALGRLLHRRGGATRLAMIVYDSGQFFWNWDVQVTGLDVDHARAREGPPGRLPPQLLPLRSAPTLLERHFVQARGPARRRSRTPSAAWCSFRQGNLLEPASYEGLGALDVDLLPQRAHLLLGRHHPAGGAHVPRDCLAPGGYLFLGHAESLSRITDLFTPIRFQGAMVYQKPAGSPSRSATVIRVLVVDDSAFVRQALARMLGTAPDIEVVGTAVDGARRRSRRCCALRPDVVTLDVKMPRMDGLEALRRIMAELPDAGAAALLAHQRGRRRDPARPRAGRHGLRGQVERAGPHEPAEPGRGAARPRCALLATVPRSRLRRVRRCRRRRACRRRGRARAAGRGGRASAPPPAARPRCRPIIPRLPAGLAGRRAGRAAHAARLHALAGRAPRPRAARCRCGRRRTASRWCRAWC